MKNPFYIVIQIVFLFSALSFYACKNTEANVEATSDVQEIEDRFEDGPLSRKFTLVKGKKEGKYVEYYHSGELLCERNFVNDLEEGKTTFYYRDGKIKEVMYLLNGNKNGGDTLFYEDGSIKYISTYKDGIRHGLLKKWDEDGEVTYEAKFNMDTLIEVHGKPVVQEIIAK
ncbi:MAG: hypothetical protein LC107_03840 [Chitinophagales bacterium]|nr:hypothetical protein [Chitinophagales bacterium]